MDGDTQSEEFRFEVAFTTSANPEVVIAARVEDIDGWTYFHTATDGWALKAQSSIIHHISRGQPTRIVTAQG